MAAAEKSETKPKGESKPREFGSWVVLDDAGQVQMVENSQLRAALAAIDIKGTIRFWPFGKARAEVMTPPVVKP